MREERRYSENWNFYLVFPQRSHDAKGEFKAFRILGFYFYLYLYFIFWLGRRESNIYEHSVFFNGDFSMLLMN